MESMPYLQEIYPEGIAEMILHNVKNKNGRNPKTNTPTPKCSAQKRTKTRIQKQETEEIEKMNSSNNLVNSTY